MCRLTEKQSYDVPLGLSEGPQQLHKKENSIRAASTNEAVDNDDPYDKMVTFLTGRTKSERTSKERAIKSSCMSLNAGDTIMLWVGN